MYDETQWLDFNILGEVINGDDNKHSLTFIGGNGSRKSSPCLSNDNKLSLYWRQINR